VLPNLVWFGSTKNWDLAEELNSGTTACQETSGVGDIVTFDDTLDAATLNTSVNVTTTVGPTLINVANGGNLSPQRGGRISGGAC
jgi:hypothetical protein